MYNNYMRPGFVTIITIIDKGANLFCYKYMNTSKIIACDPN